MPGRDAVFEIEEEVRVCDGPFKSARGYVEEVDERNARLRVRVMVGSGGPGRKMDLEFWQIEKV